jgi:hypothetical protein
MYEEEDEIEVPTDNEIGRYLSKHLKITVEEYRDYCSKGIRVSLLLGGKVISRDEMAY